MLCPFCKEKDTSVIDSRSTEDGTAIRRRRLCGCGKQRFTTFERVQFRELTVIKKNGRKSPFDREKLTKSVMTALRKRPIDNDTIEKAVLALAVEIFQAILTTGGTAQALDYTPSPYRLGRTLLYKVTGIISKYLDERGMVG